MKNQKKHDFNTELKNIALPQKAKASQPEGATAKAVKLAARNNKKWAFVAQGSRYVRALAKQDCCQTSKELTDELFDGGEICLSQRHSMKSSKAQRRIVRRIAEKKLAQKAWRHTAQTLGRYVSHVVEHSIGECMADVRQQQLCA